MAARPAAWVWRGMAIAATLLITISAVMLFNHTGRPDAPAVARLDLLGPGVTIYRMTGTDRQPMKQGSTLAQGETLVMDPGAAAIFTIQGVGKFRVAGGSTLRITGPRAIQLEKGELIADINPGGKGFEISAPQASAIVLGTLFRVSAAGERTSLTVARGSVRFSNSSGAVDVKAGYQSAALAGKSPAAPLELAADAADWDLFRSVAPAPRVELSIEAATAGKPVHFQITLSSDAPTDIEAGVTERTYVILTLEDPTGARRLVRLAAGDLTASCDGQVVNGLASIDREKRLVLKGELRGLAADGTWRVSALFASGGREDSWAGYSESQTMAIEVKR
ncbi:MAG: FecR family protein [Planctomycetota bacterium]